MYLLVHRIREQARSHRGAESSMKSHPDHSSLSAFELAFQQFVHLLRVGLALKNEQLKA